MSTPLLADFANLAASSATSARSARDPLIGCKHDGAATAYRDAGHRLSIVVGTLRHARDASTGDRRDALDYALSLLEVTP